MNKITAEFQRGEPIKLSWQATTGDPSGLSTKAVLKLAAPGPEVPAAAVAGVANFTMTFRAAAGSTGTYTVSRSQTIASVGISAFNPANQEVVNYPMTMYKCWSEASDGVLFQTNRPIIWHGGGVEGATVGISLESSAAARNIELDCADLTLRNNSSRDIANSGANNIVLTGSFNNVRMLSTTPISAMTSVSFEGMSINGVAPYYQFSNGAVPFLFGVTDYECQHNQTGGLGKGSKDQIVKVRSSPSGGASISVTHSASCKLKGAVDATLSSNTPAGGPSAVLTMAFVTTVSGATVTGFWQEVGRNF